MKLLTSFLLASALSLLGLASAQYNNQTGPFQLQIVSTDPTYNGRFFGTCHEGAAIESLCPGTTDKAAAVPFFFNYTGIAAEPSTMGLLTFVLVGGNFEVSSSLRLSYDPTSNVAVPLFFPGPDNAQYLSFDVDGFLNIIGSDPTAVPRWSAPAKPFYRWAICNTNVGYQMDTLAWIMGSGQPENPTCVPVSVRAIY